LSKSITTASARAANNTVAKTASLMPNPLMRLLEPAYDRLRQPSPRTDNPQLRVVQRLVFNKS
jgi:hypothetical protein